MSSLFQALPSTDTIASLSFYLLGLIAVIFLARQFKENDRLLDEESSL